jgi:predicted RNA binding protein YcfA (HicA-like mRNA interferase family)
VTKLPVISGDECIRALRRLGYRIVRTKGSHTWLVCEGHSPIPVPRHRELGRGILRKIISVADISVDEFIELLKR